MAITLLTFTQIGPSKFRLDFASDLPSPTFYIYVNEDLLATTLETTYEIFVPPGNQSQIEVFDDAAAVPTEHYPSQMTLRWLGRDGATQFRVDRYIGTTWTAQQIIIANASNIYHYTSAVLADSTVHQFRVTPIDAEGRDGTILSFTAEMCRYPDIPAQTMTFVGGELSIT